MEWPNAWPPLRTLLRSFLSINRIISVKLLQYWWKFLNYGILWINIDSLNKRHVFFVVKTNTFIIKPVFDMITVIFPFVWFLMACYRKHNGSCSSFLVYVYYCHFAKFFQLPILKSDSVLFLSVCFLFQISQIVQRSRNEIQTLPEEDFVSHI